MQGIRKGIHFALDCLGLLPGIGAVFDGINACWYICEGRWGEALLSGLALIPAVGIVAGAGKVGGKEGMKALSHADDMAGLAKGLDKLDDLSDAAKGLDKLDDALDVAKYGDDVINGGSKAKLDYITSNGLELRATPDKTTTVLGTYKKDTGAILDELGNVKTLDFGAKDGRFNLLNTPDELYVTPKQFWNEYNKPWLNNVISRNDIVVLATEPSWNNITRINNITGKIELTGFGKEYTYLKQHGYHFNSNTKIISK